MGSAAHNRASAKYDAANTKRVTVKFNLKTDADILQKIDSVDNVMGYIKSLIRADIERACKEGK